MFNRRNLIKKSLNGLSAVCFIKATALSKAFCSVSPFSYTAVIQSKLPKKLTEDQYVQLKSKYIDIEGLKNTVSLFKRKGFILSEKTVFKGNQSDWVVTFKNYNAFMEYKKIARKNFNLKLISDLGINIID